MKEQQQRFAAAIVAEDAAIATAARRAADCFPLGRSVALNNLYLELTLRRLRRSSNSSNSRSAGNNQRLSRYFLRPADPDWQQQMSRSARSKTWRGSSVRSSGQSKQQQQLQSGLRSSKQKTVRGRFCATLCPVRPSQTQPSHWPTKSGGSEGQKQQ